MLRSWILPNVSPSQSHAHSNYPTLIGVLKTLPRFKTVKLWDENSRKPIEHPTKVTYSGDAASKISVSTSKISKKITYASALEYKYLHYVRAPGGATCLLSQQKHKSSLNAAMQQQEKSICIFSFCIAHRKDLALFFASWANTFVINVDVWSASYMVNCKIKYRFL